MTKIPTNPPEFHEYVQGEWRGRVFAAGLRFSAVVLPESTLTQLQYLKVAAQMTSIETQYFKSVEEAKAWLQTK